MAARRSRLPVRHLPPNRSDWTFGDVLHWHLFENRTWPPESKNQGKEWSRQALADAVGADVRMVGFWLSDHSAPRQYANAIERALFGPDQGYAAKERAEFRRLSKLRRGRASGEFRGVPDRLPELFGRVSDLRRLQTLFRQANKNDRKPAVVVHGTPGVGKTALAAEFSHAMRKHYAGVWWCAADTRQGLLEELSLLGPKLGLPSEGNDAEHEAKQVIQSLAGERKPWLLVYNDIAKPDDLAGLIPHAGADVLVTSRYPDWANRALSLQLKFLSFEDSRSFLNALTDRFDGGNAERLLGVLGGLPLALEQAAAYCKQRGIRFDAYVDHVQTLIRQSQLADRNFTNIFAVFNVAIESAVATDGLAARLMSFIVECAPTAIPEFLYGGAFEDEDKLLAALRRLTDLSIVKVAPQPDGTPTITVHPIVHMVAQEWSTRNDLRTEASGCLVDRLAVIYPTDADHNSEAWALCETLTRHILRNVHEDITEEPQHDEWPDVLDRAASYLHARAFYDLAETLFLDAAVLAETRLGDHHATTLRIYNNLANVFRDRRKFNEAQQYYAKALLGREATFPEGHPAIAHVLTNYASLLASFDLPVAVEAARKMFEEALTIYEKEYGPKHEEVARVLNNFAFVHLGSGKLAEAEELFRRALDINRAINPEGPAVALNLANLASLTKQQGPHDDALEMCKEALRIRKRLFGEEHPLTIETLARVGGLERDSGNLNEAGRCLRRAFNLSEALPKESRNMAYILDHLAELELRNGNAAEAISLLTRALAELDGKFDANRPEIPYLREKIAKLSSNGAMPTLGD